MAALLLFHHLQILQRLLRPLLGSHWHSLEHVSEISIKEEGMTVQTMIKV
jgi:hypothetical protein